MCLFDPHAHPHADPHADPHAEPHADPHADTTFGQLERWELDSTSWVECAPAWLRGSAEVFDELCRLLPWRQRSGVPMYGRLVDEPRLTAWWSRGQGTPEPLPLLAEIRNLLSARYHVDFDSIGFNLYRDGNDSVAWHGDRHRRFVRQPIVAIVSLGARRTLRLRPRGGGGSLGVELGEGDLFVMGGACQHDWEHAVPKTARVSYPRLSITFRHHSDDHARVQAARGVEG